MSSSVLPQRTSSAFLEISNWGIRLLDHERQVIKAIAMSLIHSWSPASKSIVFVCTNSNMELYSIELSTTQCDAILKCLQQIVKQVLTSRKERALSETEVIDLLSAMRAAKTGSKSQLDVLKTRVSGAVPDVGQGLPRHVVLLGHLRQNGGHALSPEPPRGSEQVLTDLGSL